MNALQLCDGCNHKPEIVHNVEFPHMIAAECVCGRRTAWHLDKLQTIGEWNYRFGTDEEKLSPRKVEV